MVSKSNWLHEETRAPSLRTTPRISGTWLNFFSMMSFSGRAGTNGNFLSPSIRGTKAIGNIPNPCFNIEKRITINYITLLQLFNINTNSGKAMLRRIPTISSALRVLRHWSNSLEVAVGQSRCLARIFVYSPTGVSNTHGHFAVPDWMMARWNKPFFKIRIVTFNRIKLFWSWLSPLEYGERTWKSTLAPPALSPNMVIEFGSPPKWPTWSRTHL